MTLERWDTKLLAHFFLDASQYVSALTSLSMSKQAARCIMALPFK